MVSEKVVDIMSGGKVENNLDSYLSFHSKIKILNK